MTSVWFARLCSRSSVVTRHGLTYNVLLNACLRPGCAFACFGRPSWERFALLGSFVEHSAIQSVFFQCSFSNQCSFSVLSVFFLSLTVLSVFFVSLRKRTTPDAFQRRYKTLLVFRATHVVREPFISRMRHRTRGGTCDVTAGQDRQYYNKSKR